VRFKHEEEGYMTAWRTSGDSYEVNMSPDQIFTNRK